MWKPEYRIAADRSGLRYPSDLTGAERGQDLDGPHQGLASTVFRDRAQLMSNYDDVHERRLERLGGGSGHRLRRRLRERPAHQLDRLARDITEAGSQARMLERRRRCAQCIEIFFRHPDHCRHLSSTFSIALIRNGRAPIKVSRRCRQWKFEVRTRPS